MLRGLALPIFLFRPEVLPHPISGQIATILQSLLEREGDKDRVIKMDLV